MLYRFTSPFWCGGDSVQLYCNWPIYLWCYFLQIITNIPNSNFVKQDFISNLMPQTACQWKSAGRDFWTSSGIFLPFFFPFFEYNCHNIYCRRKFLSNKLKNHPTLFFNTLYSSSGLYKVVISDTPWYLFWCNYTEDHRRINFVGRNFRGWVSC